MYKVGFLLGLLTLPVVTFAQGTAAAASFVAIFNSVILYPTIGLLSAVALLVFLFGCFQYIAMAGNDQARSQGVKHITWGIVGLVVMLSAYAILSIVAGTFGLGGELEDAREGNAVVTPPGGGTGPIAPVGGGGTGPIAPVGGGGTGPF